MCMCAQVTCHIFEKRRHTRQRIAKSYSRLQNYTVHSFVFIERTYSQTRTNFNKVGLKKHTQ